MVGHSFKTQRIHFLVGLQGSFSTTSWNKPAKFSKFCSVLLSRVLSLIYPRLCEINFIYLQRREQKNKILL